MLEEFTDVVIRRRDILKIVPNGNFVSKLVYPKLVIISENRYITIIDIHSKEDNGPCERDYFHETEANIVDAYFQDQLLWLILESGELILYDLFSGLQLPLILDGLTCRFKKIKYDGNKIYLMSDSEFCFVLNESAPKILSRFNASDKEIHVTLTKVQKDAYLCAQKYGIAQFEENEMGVFLEIYRGAVIIKCALTGLRAIAAPIGEFNWNHVVAWGEKAILSDGSGIWVVSLIDTNIQLTINGDAATYIPLASQIDSFYYLKCTEDEVQIHWVHKASTIEEEGLNSTTSDVQNSRLQKSLKDQVEQLVMSAINDGPLSEISNRLEGLFSNIDDIQFLLDKSIALCHHDIRFKFLLNLLYVRANSDKVSKKISNLLSRIELIEYIRLLEIDRYDEANVFETDFVELCIQFINNSDLDLASMAWVKLFRFYGEVSVANIMSLLDATPHNIKMNSFILWLKHFIPSVLENNPFYIELFVNWSTERVFSFEKSPYWPKIGIKFIDEILYVLETSQKKFIPIRPIAMDSLDVLKLHISKIFELKEKYKINVLLGELSSLGPMETALIKLQRCYTEDLEIFIRDYMAAFATENLLEIDSILRKYIEIEISCNGGGVDDARLQIILNAFHSNAVKYQCLLDVLRTLEVPWSAAMLELAIACVKVQDKEYTVCDADLQLIHSIKMEINYANLKVVLKKYNFPLDMNDYMLVLNKIADAETVDINDLKIVMQSMSGYSNYGSVLYISRCLQDNSVKKALDYFNGLSGAEKKILSRSLVIKYEFIIDQSTNSSMIERNYLDLFKGTHSLNSRRMLEIENMYHLKNSYNIRLSLNEMSCESKRVDKIKQWFSDSGERASTGRGASVCHLAHLPHSFTTILVELLSQTYASVTGQSLVESLVTIFTKNEVKFEEINSLLSYFKDTSHSIDLWNCCMILVHLIQNCPEEYLHILVTVLTILSSIVNTSIIVKHLTIACKFHYIFVPMSNISSTENLISFYIDVLSQNGVNQNYVNKLNVNNDFVPFRMLAICTYTRISTNTYGDGIFFESKEMIAKRIISNILQSQECDELLLASSLLMLNSTMEQGDRTKPDWLWNTFDGLGESVSTAISKYLSSPMMRHALAFENCLLTNPGISAPHFVLKTKYNLSLADLALPDITEDTWDANIVLYYVLRSYPNTSLQRLVGFCQTLNVDIDYGLSLQLISLLVGWELKYSICSDDWEYPQMKYKNDENTLYSTCSVIWNSIKNKTFLTDVLKDFWKKGEVSLHGRLVSINPYYYEIYMCIYKLVGTQNDWLKKNECYLLNFLQDYRRISTPKQYEFELFSVKGIFPEIGHYRLPFQLFMREDMWAHLKLEITLATYEQWLPIVTLLGLDEDLQIACDMLCSNALKQTMTSRKRNNESNLDEKHNEPWRLEAKEEPLLRAAHKCVRHIANMEWAAACLFYVLQGCARGADQVAAAQLCYHFAQRWAAIQPANRAVRQMEKLHGTLSTRHALHKIDWPSEELLKFVAEPSQLIRTIYFHPEFINKMSRYDVNRAVDEIADKNNVNVSSIRIQILENILEQKYAEKRDKGDNVGLNHEDLMRAKYILKATCPKMGAVYLARIAFEDDTVYNKNKKLRALQCLISIVEPDTAVKVTSKERESLWCCLIDLFFAIRLEKVDMPWAVSTLDKDRIRTLEQVCSASESSCESLQLAAELTVRYGCEENIRKLIPRLITTNLHDVLSILLSRIFICPDDLIRRAWRAVLLSPFLHADYPITDRQRQGCLKTINLLPLCSCLTDEDLSVVWKNLVRIKCYPIACLILPFMSREARESLSELKRIDKRNLIASLKNLQTESYLINGALTVIENTASRKIR